MPLPPSLESALQAAGVTERDARGLMPVDQAWSVVHSTTAFRKRPAARVNGVHTWLSDRVWAGLVSLPDAESFCGEARRLAWRFHPRQPANLAAVERFGSGILPWLSTRIDPYGVLVDVPWCVVPSLIALDTPSAFAVVRRVRIVDPREAPPGPGPFAADSIGDVDRQGIRPLRAPEKGVDGSANHLLLSWVDAHPEVAFPLLVEGFDEGDDRMGLAIKAMATSDPPWAWQHLVAGVGEERAREVWARADAPT